MDEITIFKLIKAKFIKAKKDVRDAWLIGILWMIESILVLIFLNMFPVLMYLLIFVPMSGVLVLIFLSIRKEFLLARKFPLVYNKWLSETYFVDNIRQRAHTRAQPDPNYVKIDNYGLDYIDSILNTYGDDKQKIANAFYNAITDSSMIDEIRFFKKYKKFTNDMQQYRGRV